MLTKTSANQKAWTCFMAVASITVVTVVGCCVLSLSISMDRVSESVLPTQTPLPTGLLIVQTYDELETTLIFEMWDGLSIMVALIESPNFDPDRLLWAIEFDNSYMGAINAYGNLKTLQPPPEREERHIEIVELMVDCDTSVRWFKQGVDNYRQGDNLTALNEIVNGYDYYGLCGSVILADFGID